MALYTEMGSRFFLQARRWTSQIFGQVTFVLIGIKTLFILEFSDDDDEEEVEPRHSDEESDNEDVDPEVRRPVHCDI